MTLPTHEDLTDSLTPRRIVLQTLAAGMEAWWRENVGRLEVLVMIMDSWMYSRVETVVDRHNERRGYRTMVGRILQTYYWWGGRKLYWGAGRLIKYSQI